MKLIKNTLSLSLALLLFFIATLQLNDPDALFWTLLYLFAGTVPLISLTAAKHKLLRTLVPGMACGYCLAGLALVSSGMLEYSKHLQEESLVQEMSLAKPYVEEAREFIGTLIALVTVTVYWTLMLRETRTAGFVRHSTKDG